MSKATPISNRDLAVSISLMLCSALSLSLVTFFAKQLTTFTELSILIFIRSFIPFLILVWVSVILFDRKINVSNARVHLLRAVFTVSSQYCLFYYLTHGSLLLGTLLFSTSGLFLPFISYICFRKAIKTKTLIAVIISFIGVAFILNPKGNINLLMLIGLLAGFLNGCSQATMHYCSKRSDTFSMTIIMYGLSSLYAFIILILLGKFSHLVSELSGNTATIEFWLIAILFSLFTITNQSLRVKAYRYVNNPTTLTPFFYTAILFSGVLDWLVYHRVPLWNTYTGMIFIFIGGVIIAWRGNGKKTKCHPNRI
ncbi:MAG: DMT family transporter [Pseudomonadota bacterium]